jgi:deoxyribodipyrimidine photolyase
MKALYWIRNDLRVHDNAALTLFCEQASYGIVVWCANKSFDRAGERRRNFILKTVEELAVKIRAQGVPVIISVLFF